MDFSTKKIYDCFHSILSGGMANKNSYSRWCKGFRGEQEFKNKLNDLNIATLDGGWFRYIRDPNTHRLQTPYWTVSTDNESAYSDLYSAIAKLEEVTSLYFIRFLGFENNRIKNPLFSKKKNNGLPEILNPRFECKIFNPTDKTWSGSCIEDIKQHSPEKGIDKCAYKPEEEMRYLLKWPNADLALLYAERFVWLISHADRKAGAGMDIDHVTIIDDKIIINEQKAKDPAGKFKCKAKKVEDENGIKVFTKEEIKKQVGGGEYDRSKWSFGWDGRRVVWYMHFAQRTGLDVWYVIKELDNQFDRNEVCWKYILLDDFYSQIDHGSGRGDTVTAPYLLFEKLE